MKNLHDRPRMGRIRCQGDGGRPVAWLVRGHSRRGSKRQCFWNLDYFEFCGFPMQMTGDVIAPFVMRQVRGAVCQMRTEGMRMNVNLRGSMYIREGEEHASGLRGSTAK